MLDKPLTAEEKQQEGEWDNLVFGSGKYIWLAHLQQFD
jgi:hypothetical protein